MAIRGLTHNIASDRLSGRNSGYGRPVAMIGFEYTHKQTEQVTGINQRRKYYNQENNTNYIFMQTQIVNVYGGLNSVSTCNHKQAAVYATHGIQP